MLVEIVRLLVTLATTALGFRLGQLWLTWFPSTEVDSDLAIVTGAIVGAGVGYVLGGAMGRWVRTGLVRAPRLFSPATAPQLFGGAFGLLAGILIGVVVAVPLIVALPAVVGWPLAALLVLLLGVFGSKVFAARVDEMIAALGGNGPAGRVSLSAAEGTALSLIDSSAAIDGRVLELGRAGLLGDTLAVPAFVVDELQAIADSADKSRRRRGRRGLDVLDALRVIPSVTFIVLEETVPEHDEVDAKLLALAGRAEAKLITTDHNLGRAAGLRGIPVVNPHALGELLRPGVSSGDCIELTIERAGSEADQGVGFLEDGTMVVVSDGAGLIGETISVEVSNALRTSVGRMLFARVAT